MSQKVNISVIGSHDPSKESDEVAYKIGQIIAQNEAVLVCGGLDGVMQAAAKGAQEAGGTTIGILPGKDKTDANPYINIALPTSIGFARNTIVACCADIIIALPGSHGTRSEISYGLVYNRIVIDLGGWNIKGMISVKDVKEAELKLKESIENLRKA